MSLRDESCILMPSISQLHLFYYSYNFYCCHLFSTKVVAVGTKGKEKDKDAGLTTQIKGTTMIRKLCRVVMNLEQVRLNFIV